MATTYDKASLVMIPSGYKDDKLYSIKPTDGSGDFTFSRDGAGASPATRVNASGYIEKGRENVLLQSNQFDTTWANASSTDTGGQADKDGGTDAWLLEKNAVNGRIQQTISNSGVQTFSVYAKAGTSDWMSLMITTGSGDRVAFFDLANGVVGLGFNLIDKNIESVGGGWYRCSITFNETSITARVYVSDGNNDNSGTSGNIYIQDAQLESGLVSTSYIETTTTAVSAGLLGDMPRLDYSGGATCPSLLLEPSRVNSIAFSEYYGDSAWTKANVALTDNSATSPEGVTNAAKLAENASGNNLYAVYEQFTPSLGTYTFSGFMKKGTLRYGGIRAIVNAGANRFFVNADLETGVIVDTDVVGTGVTWSYDIEDYGNGWYRLWISGAHSIAGFVDLSYALSDSATPTYTSALPTYVASGSDYNYIYGAQIEAGSYPTSYIPTYGSASTRGADRAEVENGTSVLPTGYPFTLYAESVVKDSNHLLSFLDRNASNKYYNLGWDGSNFNFVARPDGTSFLVTSADTYSEGTHKVAAVITNTSMKLFVDGELQASSSSVPTFVSTINDFLIGQLRIVSDTGIRTTNKQTLIINDSITDAEAIALTTL